MLKLPSHIPELDGLRGIAILLVLIYHCHTKLHSLEPIAEWGWIGVNLFFVLSGFLITGILADSRRSPRFFRNFYARRALRIWPVYILLLVVYYFLLPLIFHDYAAFAQIRTAPWLLYALLIQNLAFVALPGPIGPTWSLAIEEQFYLFWAPAVRFLSVRLLMPLLIAVWIASPFIRMAGRNIFTPTHTVTHLDGLAIGSLIALSFRSLAISVSTWRAIGSAMFGVSAATFLITRTHTYAYTDSFLSLGFGGMLIVAVLAGEKGRLAAEKWYSAALRSRPLAFLGRISYGLYMFHILCFVVIGVFDLRMLRYGAWGDLAVITARFALSIAFATLLWYGFESRILRLKRYFSARPKAAEALTARAGTE
jgi:peptidoglycan/LPS O-acetylase OafA/YrhL